MRPMAPPNMIVRATRKSVMAVPYDELHDWFQKIGNISKNPITGSYARVDDVRAVSVLPATERTLLLLRADLAPRPLPGDVVVFIEMTESVLSNAMPDSWLDQQS